MEFRILGSLEVCSESGAVALGGIKPRAVLAFLLLHPNQPVHAERLALAVWGQDAPARAVQTVQVYVSRLRKALGDAAILATSPAGYCLRVRPDELDAERFARLVEDGRHALAAGQAQRAAAVLREALALWRGPPLAELAFEPFAQAEIARLEEQRLSALEAKVDCQLQLGEHGAIIGELQQLVAANPGRERLAEQLMLALYRCGRQGDALEVYARTRVYLSGELGLEPGPALRAVQAEILAQSPALRRFSGEPGVAALAYAPAPEQADLLPTGVVTFLLTDIEDSTRLWEADADAMGAALELHEGLIAGLVERHGGRLLKERGEGDATLSAFQRASGAVACAAELQHAVATASWPPGFDLRLRIALHSGEARERAGDYFGPVLNRAARLRTLAPGGVTVLSQSTAELVRDRLPRELALADIGRHELRGLSRPERVFELRATTGASASGSAVATGSVKLPLPHSLHAPAGSPFAGRDAELARLRERWTAVCDGTPSTVVMGGEAGIGKTRLASELAGAIHEQGALVLYGRCDEGLAVPYQPFVEALRPYARALGPDRHKTDLGRLAPELGRLLPELEGLGEPLRADPETERFALFEAVTALLEAATREQPTLLVLDDLHWAARPTLLLLRHVIRSERPLRALVFGTYRGTEIGPEHPLAQMLADLQRDASAERMSIEGLDDNGVATLLRAAASPAFDERPAELARMLRRQTGGNPFFIRELLAHLCESRAISLEGDGAISSLESAELEVPEGLRQVIRQRVGRLSEPAQVNLSMAAVAGPTFSLALLERAQGEHAGGLDALDEALSAGLLIDAGPGEYTFAHALVRQAIYGQLSSARRMRLHRQLGEALEPLPAVEAHVEALAHHFAEAAADGQAEKAVAYALAAGQSATARLGYEEAADHYERGLKAFSLAEQLGDDKRCELLLALGEVRWSAGQLEKARDACLHAAEVAERVGDSDRLARAALAFGGPPRFEVGAAVIEPVVRLLERALVALGDDESALRARVLGHLASASSFSRSEERKPELARQALEMARRVGDKATLADVLATSHWATRALDNLEERLSTARELARLATELDDGKLAALAHYLLSTDLLELGDIEGVERELEALEALAEALRQRYPKFLAVLGRARRAYLGGRLEECEQLAHEALALGLGGRDEYAAQVVEAQMGVLRREQGRLGELMDGVERLAERYPELPSWRCGLAYVYAELSRKQDARRELEALAGADFSDLPSDGLWLTSMSHLSAVVVFLDDTRRAQRLYDLLLPYAGRCAVTLAVHCQGSVSRSLGLLASTMLRFEEAARHFEEALDMNARIRSRLWVAHTRHDYARMLLRRGSPADGVRALELLDEALAAAEELGLRALADRARPLKLDAEAAASV